MTRRRALLTSVFCLLLACSGSPTRVNVVWVVMDAAAARHFSAWGAELPTSPELGRLSREAVLFERAYAQWPSTVGSTGSFLTGLYPPPGSEPGRLAETTLADRLRAEGWQTGAFSENPFVSELHGFSRGFEDFVEVEPVRPEAHPILDEARRDTATTISRSLAWVDARQGEAFFLYLHLLPPHLPYEPPAPFGGRFQRGDYTGPFDGTAPAMVEALLGTRRPTEADLAHLRSLYAENIAFVDHQVGRLYDGLAQRGLLEDTILLVSSDHGEAFGEHGSVLHGTSVYDEQIHVPLLIRFPGQFGLAPRRWPGIVELVDLVPTVLDVLRLPRDGLPGRSLVASLSDASERTAPVRAWVTWEDVDQAAVIGPRFKLVRDLATNRDRLYDLSADALERNDIAVQEPIRLAEMAALLGEALPTVHYEPSRLDSDRKEQLEALGYVDP